MPCQYTHKAVEWLENRIILDHSNAGVNWKWYRAETSTVQGQVVIRSQQRPVEYFSCLSRVSWPSLARKPGIGLGILGLVGGYF